MKKFIFVIFFVLSNMGNCFSDEMTTLKHEFKHKVFLDYGLGFNASSNNSSVRLGYFLNKEVALILESYENTAKVEGESVGLLKNFVVDQAKIFFMHLGYSFYKQPLGRNGLQVAFGLEDLIFKSEKYDLGLFMQVANRTLKTDDYLSRMSIEVGARLYMF